MKQKGSPSRPVSRHFLTAIALLVVFIFSVGLRVWKSIDNSSSHAPYRASDDTGYFWSESALQYYFAKRVAEGGAIPPVDTRVEHPTGIRPFTDVSVFMEPICGFLYRVLRLDSPFHLFVIVFTATTSSLTIFPIFAIAYLICASEFAAFAGAAIYALNFASFSRAAGTFEYENFSLPFIIAGLALTLWSMAKSESYEGPKKYAFAIGAAASFLLALASWHLAAILSLTFFLVAAFAYVTSGSSKGARASLIITSTGILIGAALIPVLRARQLPFSLLAACLYGITLYAFLEARFLQNRARLPRLLCLLVCILASAPFCQYLAPVGDQHSHVLSLFLSKARFLLQKPSDPAMLPFEARALWVEELKSPSLGSIVGTFVPTILAPLIIFALSRQSAKRGTEDAPEAGWQNQARWICIGMLLLSGMSYLAIARLSVFFVVFLAIASALAIDALSIRSVKAGMILGAGLLLAEAGRAYLWTTANQPFARALNLAPDIRLIRFTDQLDLVRWIRLHSERDNAFLAPYQTSPLILAWADRPIILHPKFESSELRRRFADFLKAAFDTEDKLAGYALKHGASYYIHQIDVVLNTSDDGYRFQGGRLALTPESASLRMQYEPDTLSRFRLVFQNSTFRVFKVLPTTESPHPSRRAYVAWYDKSSFGDPYGGPEISSVLRLQSRIKAEQLLLSKAFSKSAPTEVSASLSELQKHLPNAVHKAEVLAAIGSLEIVSGNYEGGVARLRKALKEDSNSSAAHRQLAIALFNRGLLAAALQHAQIAAEINPLDETAFVLIGSINGRLGRYSPALRALKQASRLGWPDPRLQEQIGLLERQLRR